ncbi:adenylate kinase family protein [Cellulosilyticum ruminicola]|uniref:AAA family ATPase n=1 Tax=Cellulosilyticum ruminicola TaxID=425254 RepID=UPI0006D02628|nr:AAA family ATPase [Cellulosilyticum ruminicola]
MIIILNGTCGVGKTTAAWLLLDSLYGSVMMDADHICATNPFVLKDSQREKYLNDTMMELIKFHRKNGYKNFIISNVYENSSELETLLQNPELQDEKVFVYRLTGEAEVIRQRIIKRNTYDVEWELKRFIELQATLDAYNETQEIGKIIDTTNMSIGEIVYTIKRDILNSEVR